MANNEQTRSLVRLLAGLMGPKSRPEPNFAPPQLPPFEQPGQMMAQYRPPVMPPAQAPQAAPMPQQAPPMQQGPQPWLALNDQTRTAAFDPVRDFSDPNNAQMVDEFGRLITKNGLLGPI